MCTILTIYAQKVILQLFCLFIKNLRPYFDFVGESREALGLGKEMDLEESDDFEKSEGYRH